MRQAGVTEAPARERRPRAWVDFGVDETWEPARPTRTRRERRVDSWVDDAELFAPRYEDDLEPAPLRREAIATRPAPERVSERVSAVAVPSRWDTAPSDPRGGNPRAARQATDRAAATPHPRVRRRPDDPHGAAMVVETEAGPVSVDVLAHPAHVPSPVRAVDPASATAGPLSPSALAGSAPADDAVAGAGVPGRRTVTIRGRGAERDLAFPEPGRPRRPPVRRHERPGFKPDRTALWALLLGVVLVLVAATSSHAAALSHARPAARSAAPVTHSATAPAARVRVVAIRR